jgi:hypothetical protein
MAPRVNFEVARNGTRRLPMRVNPTRRHGKKGEETKGSVDVIYPRYGRAKTSALLVGPPFGYASPCAGFEPYVARRLE